MTDDEAISLREYIQDRLKDMEKAVATNSADVQRSLSDIKVSLDQLWQVHGTLSEKYVPIGMFHIELQQRFDNVDRIAKQLVETVGFRFEAIEKATALAAASIDHRLEGMNEFRAQMNDQQQRLMQRTEYEAKHQELVSRIDNVARGLSDAKDQHHLFITKDELEAFRKEMLSRFESADVARENIVTRVAGLEKIYANMQGRISAIAVGITVLSIAIATVLHFIPV
jgi:prefoldin subunit 5